MMWIQLSEHYLKLDLLNSEEFLSREEIALCHAKNFGTRDGWAGGRYAT